MAQAKATKCFGLKAKKTQCQIFLQLFGVRTSVFKVLVGIMVKSLFWGSSLRLSGLSAIMARTIDLSDCVYLDLFQILFG